MPAGPGAEQGDRRLDRYLGEVGDPTVVLDGGRDQLAQPTEQHDGQLARDRGDARGAPLVGVT
jgi:hypothetical protein